MRSFLNVEVLHAQDVNGQQATRVFGEGSVGNGLNPDDAVDAFVF